MVIRSLFNFYISLILICSLAALNKSSKMEKTKMEKQIVQMLRRSSHRIKKTRKKKIEMMKFLALILDLLTRLTHTLNFSFCYLLVAFKKSVFRRELSFELPSMNHRVI